MFMFLFLLGLALGTVSSEEPAQATMVEMAAQTEPDFNGTLFFSHAESSYAGCPLFWQSFNGRCYKYFKTETNWADAELNCLLYQANLVSVHDQKENKFIRAMIQDNNPDKHTWIGLSDIHKEGVWMWSDGSNWDFSFWHTGEPNSEGDEDCVHMLGSESWNDISCSNYYPSICKTRIVCPQ